MPINYICRSRLKLIGFGKNNRLRPAPNHCSIVNLPYSLLWVCTVLYHPRNLTLGQDKPTGKSIVLIKDWIQFCHSLKKNYFLYLSHDILFPSATMPTHWEFFTIIPCSENYIVTLAGGHAKNQLYDSGSARIRINMLDSNPIKTWIRIRPLVFTENCHHSSELQKFKESHKHLCFKFMKNTHFL